MVRELKLLAGALALLASNALGQSAPDGRAPPQITIAIDEGHRVTLGGNTRPEANPTNDRGMLPDETPLRALCPRMVCTACGLIGADVRPDWSAHTNKRSN